MILHIPHASTNTLNRNIENFDISYLTDWFTDDLFHHPNSDRLVFEYSRFFTKYYDQLLEIAKKYNKENK